MQRAAPPVSDSLHASRIIAMETHEAAIAQLVEHLIRNEGVGGSNPSCGTIPPFASVRF